MKCPVCGRETVPGSIRTTGLGQSGPAGALTAFLPRTQQAHRGFRALLTRRTVPLEDAPDAQWCTACGRVYAVYRAPRLRQEEAETDKD